MGSSNQFMSLVAMYLPYVDEQFSKNFKEYCQRLQKNIKNYTILNVSSFFSDESEGT